MINLDKKKNYLLACSFGPDSMALFAMLKKEKIQFSAALVNYHLREESTDEMNGFIRYCQEQNISYHIKDLIYGIPAVNVEAECRRIRYEFFAELTRQFKYDAVLVAHNQDDVIETYIMQKKRQNLPVFYGISPKTIINNTLIIRPLFNYSKQELLKYCEQNKVPFAIDSSNLEDRYLRNRIRHQQVSKMSKEERAKIVKEINDKNSQLDAMFKKLENLDLYDVETLKKLDDIELAYALNLLAKKADGRLHISLRQIHAIRLVLNNSNGNIDIPLQYGIILRKSYDKIELVKPLRVHFNFVLNEPCEMDNEYFHLNFLGDTSNRNVKLDDYPLTIRTYQKGDKYQIKNYVVSVRRLFIDWKMPLSLRMRWPIIVNKDGVIIYIPRYRWDFIPDKNCNFYIK